MLMGLGLPLFVLLRGAKFIVIEVMIVFSYIFSVLDYRDEWFASWAYLWA